MDVSDAKRLKALEDENAPAQTAPGRVAVRPGCAEGSPLAKVVTPADRQEAVATLVECHAMSERRACAVMARIGRPSATAADAPTITNCASACGRWRPNAAGSATGGCTFCSGERAMP